MTAPLFLADAGQVAAAAVGGLFDLAGPEGRHAVGVRRLVVGEAIDIGDGQGTVLQARVAALTGREALRAEVLARWITPAPQPRVVVVQALPKGDRAEQAVETLTEVGVDVIVPW
ncbi:MAG: RNA methyltransferase PUA domain-containing protein, partial [Candidatus Nanopelagicales bacterium]